MYLDGGGIELGCSSRPILTKPLLGRSACHHYW